MAHHPLFRPLLAGATLRDRVVACVGACIGIALAGLVAAAAMHPLTGLPTLVAPLGASAVLVFAVPSSPLAQPWAVVGGNTVSALVGVLVARLVPDPVLAGGLAVGGAILVMSLMRCLHPPGGAAALTAVIGGPAVASAGLLFPITPVALDSILLLAAGWVFHRRSGHSYPHRPVAPPPGPTLLHRADIDRALTEAGDAFDISADDLNALLQRAEAHAAERRTGR